MKEEGSNVYSHYHSATINTNNAKSMDKIIRIAKEIADLSNALPCESDSAVFLRVD
jgi:hypothetical protein